MMAPTHVVFGPVLAIPLLVVAPELAVVGAIAAIIGSLMPDLDAVIGAHRKTLHYPVFYWFPAVPAFGLAIVEPAASTVGAALFFAAAGVHSVLDAVGASDEPRPWERSSDRGVYLHRDQRWLRARHWIRYDGAPEDVGIAVVLAVPGIVLFADPVRTIVVAAVAIGIVYGAVRKRLPRQLDPLLGGT